MKKEEWDRPRFGIERAGDKWRVIDRATGELLEGEYDKPIVAIGAAAKANKAKGREWSPASAISTEIPAG